jgi:tetratricopeptide (TPR) repeat protein
VGADGGDEEEVSRPDPKSRLPTIHDLGEARRLIAEGRHAKALALLEQVAEREPQSANGLELMGSTYLSVRRYQDAGRAYERLLELDPRNLPALTNMGMLAVSVRNAPAAISYFERAPEVSPDDPIVLLNLGQLRFRVLGDRERGRPLLERFLQVAPDDPAAGMVSQLLAANPD